MTIDTGGFKCCGMGRRVLLMLMTIIIIIVLLLLMGGVGIIGCSLHGRGG